MLLHAAAFILRLIRDKFLLPASALLPHARRVGIPTTTIILADSWLVSQSSTDLLPRPNAMNDPSPGHADPPKAKHSSPTIALAFLSTLSSAYLTFRLGRDCGGTQLWGWPLSAVCGLGGFVSVTASTFLAYLVGLLVKGKQSGEIRGRNSDHDSQSILSRRPASELTEALLPQEESCSECEDSSSGGDDDVNGGSDSTVSSSSTSSCNFGQPNVLDLDLDEAKKIAIVDHCLAVWREVILLISYIILTALSFVLGIEAVDLGQGDFMGGNGTISSPVTLANVGYIGALLSSLQLSFFAWKQILTEEQSSWQTLLDLRAVHVHPIRYSVERFDAYCDICSEEIKNGECFRCVVCDFDYCLHCFRRGKRNQD